MFLNSVSTDSLLVAVPHRCTSRRPRGAYHLNMWAEVKKRWLVGGILLAVLVSVVAPELGAPGGPLRMELVTPIARALVYMLAGTHGARWRGGARASLAVTLQARVAAPLLAVLLAASDVADVRVASGLVSLSLGGGCSWLALALCPRAALPVAAAGLATTLTAPIAFGVLCGHFSLPPLGGLASSVLSAATPFLIGVLYRRITLHYNNNSHNNNNSNSIQDCDTRDRDLHCADTDSVFNTINATINTNNLNDIDGNTLINIDSNNFNLTSNTANYTTTNTYRNVTGNSQHSHRYDNVMTGGTTHNDTPTSSAAVSSVVRSSTAAGSALVAGAWGEGLMLLLLYAQCCELLRDTPGSLHVGDVLGAFLLVVSWLFLCWVSAGVVARRSRVSRRLVLACALSKLPDDGWVAGSACAALGL